MTGWWHELEQEGPAREVTGNTPLLLDDNDGVWLVLSERVDVFAVPTEAGQPCGARIHVLRVEAGQLVFGTEPDASGTPMRLLAVGVPGTRVLRLSRARLLELGRDPEWDARFGALLENWVEGLTGRICGSRGPRECVPLQPGKETTVEGPASASPAKGTLWVAHLQGQSHFLGKTELHLNGVNGFFPLSSSGWLEVGNATRLRAVSTRTVFADSSLWSGLAGFHRIVLACLAGGVRQSAETERERLQKRTQADHRLMQSALAQLSAVAEASQTDRLVREESADPLFAACRLVADRLAIAISPPAGPRDGTKRSDRLGDIARASHFRTRRVCLADQWWRQDNGPLLAFRAADGSPVALLPTSARSYELVDPVTQTRMAVTAMAASTLADFAHTFYRPLPARALRAWDLIRFGLQGCGRDLGLIFLFAHVGGLLGMVTPIATGILFDTVVPESEHRQLLVVTLALLVSAVTATLFQLSRDIALLRVKGKMDASIESGIWDRLLSLPVPFFRRYAAGDLAVRAMGIGVIRQMLTEVVVSSLFAGVFSFLNVGLLFCYDVRLAMVAGALLFIVLGIMGLSVYLQLPLQRTVYTIRGKIAGLVLQLITGISRIRVAAAEGRALAIWAKEFSSEKRFAYRARIIANHFAVVFAVVPLLTTMTVFATVAAMRNDSLSLGGFLAFNAAFAQVLAAIIMLSTTLNFALRIIPIYERVQPILEALPEVDPIKSEAGELSGEIEISHASFRYKPDGPPVLDDVTMHIKPGAFVAFVGPSGAGKSTLLRLLLGFEFPQAGSIYYDRQDLAGLDLHSVRRQMGVVLQNGRVIAGDLLTNIIGSSLLTLEDAWEAARLSGLEEDIKQLPMGMHTVITEGGSTLSGGQRQRLMIARAIVSRPRILLFDEATSALDNKTQAIVSRSLEGLKATRIVVAHRLSTIRNADVIYVLEGGRIVQQGTYEELIQQEGLFADLARRQLT